MHQRSNCLLVFLLVGAFFAAFVVLLSDATWSLASKSSSEQTAATAPAQPVPLHRIKISSSGRHLERLDGSPFLYIGDTEWLLTNHADSRIDALLDDRKGRGFTVIKLGATGLNADYKYDRRDINGNIPFIRGNITRLDAGWWTRIREIVRKCARRDLVVELTMGGPGRNESSLITPPTYQQLYEYGRQVGTLMSNETNVIFSIGQDMHATDGVGVTGWCAMAEGVADGVNGENRFDGRANYDTTLMTFHPSGMSPYTSAIAFHGDAWLDFNSIEVFHCNAKVYDAVSGDYRRSPPKPAVLVEGSYEEDGAELNNDGIPISVHYMRVEAWHAIFAGSAGYVYGHRDNYAQTASIGYSNSPGIRQTGVLRDFLCARKWWKLVPDQGIVSSGAGGGTSRLAAVRSLDGDEAYVYYPAQTSAAVELNRITGSNSVRAGWFDPRNGNTQAVGTYSSSQTITPAWPSGWEDAVLMLNAAPSVPAPSASSGASSPKP